MLFTRAAICSSPSTAQPASLRANLRGPLSQQQHRVPVRADESLSDQEHQAAHRHRQPGHRPFRQHDERHRGQVHVGIVQDPRLPRQYYAVTILLVRAMSNLSISARSPIIFLHALSGLLLAGFVLVHLCNFVLTPFDLPRAIKMLAALRIVYRWTPVEILLLAAVLCQLASGVSLAAVRSNRPGNRVEKAARISGYYLLFFLIIHVAAVFWGRQIAHIDTNIFFAAAGFHVRPYAGFLAAYYFFAVVCVFVHLGRAASNRLAPRSTAQRSRWLIVCGATGVTVAILILVGLSGIGNGMVVPIEYLVAF